MNSTDNKTTQLSDTEDEFDLSMISIGDRFFLNEQEYMCTDKGSRVLVGVQIDEKVIQDPSWLNGPPYALSEMTFDENDFPAISLQR
ncbi:hypothetical protein, partial [Maribacter flavus]|uniref:hypothetical protein n=1 Tax=Maribacter flavus TaxID=1658664 RepID=UPI003D358215